MADFDLSGVQIGTAIDDPRQAFGNATCLSVSAGEYILLARDPDTALTGGLPETPYTLDFTLVNGGGERSALSSTDEVIDHITFDAVSDGASTSLDPDFFDAADNDDTNECSTNRC